MLQKTTRKTTLVILLLAILPFTTGCATSPQRNAPDSQSSTQGVILETLEPGQRVEAVIIEPAGKIKKQRVRGIINPDHQLMIPQLGTFDTNLKTRAQLEQEMLASFNQGNNLKGTVRLNLVTMETTGLFLPATSDIADQLLTDEHQKNLLEQDNHPLWQWVYLDDSVTMFASPLGKPAIGIDERFVQGSPKWQAMIHHDKAAVFARPAHTLLAGQSLQDNVVEAHITRNPVNQYRNVTVQLSPAAGTALKTLGQTHLEQPLMIVLQGTCVYTATLSPYMGKILVITSGNKRFTDEQIKQLMAVFEPQK